MNIRKFIKESIRKYFNEGYDDVNLDYIKSRPKLNDYSGYDNKIEINGYTYLNKLSEPDDEFVLWGNIIVFDNEDGTEVANSSYSKETVDSPMRPSVDVRPDKRRLGIASNMYKWMEKLTGEKLHPDVPHSKSAEALWANPNRKFGIK